MDLSSHSHGQFAIGGNEKTTETIVIFFFIFILKWQTSRANVIANLKGLNKLPETIFSLQLKNGIIRSTGVGCFISLLKTGRDAKAF